MQTVNKEVRKTMKKENFYKKSLFVKIPPKKDKVCTFSFSSIHAG